MIRIMMTVGRMRVCLSLCVCVCACVRAGCVCEWGGGGVAPRHARTQINTIVHTQLMWNKLMNDISQVQNVSTVKCGFFGLVPVI